MAAIEFWTPSSMELGDLIKASSQSEILALGSCPPYTRSRVASRLRFNVLWCTQPDGRPLVGGPSVERLPGYLAIAGEFPRWVGDIV